MNWSFAQSGLLGGLVLAAAPIIIHLIYRKRAVPHAFAAMEFLLRSMRRSKPGINLKAILLMLLRLAAILCWVLAVAGLRRVDGAAALPVTHEPKTVIVLWDVSASTGPLHENTRQTIKAFIESLGDADEIAVAAFDESALALGVRPFGLKAEALKSVAAVKPGFRATRAGAALREGLRLAKTAAHPRREIHLFTDLAGTGWQRSEIPTEEWRSAVPPPELVIHDIQPAADPTNLAVTALTLRENPADLGVYEFTTTIANLSGATVRDVPVVLTVENKEAARSFQSFAPHEEKAVAFSYRAAARGMQAAAVSVSDAGITADNQRYAVIDPKGAIKVLLVDGNPQPNPMLSDTYFAARALTPTAGREATLLPLTVTVQEFTPALVQGQDLVLLANVRSLDPRRIEALRTFVAKGGALWIALGDQVNVETYNQIFGDLLPSRLRDVRHEDPPITLASAPRDHPVFRGFTDADLALMSLPKFSAYVVLQSGRGDLTDTLLTFTSGSPALIMQRYKQGRVALWTASLSRQWSDFPIQTTFLPFVHSLCVYLGGGGAEKSLYDVRVGDALVIKTEAAAAKIRVRGPARELWEWPVDRLAEGYRGVKVQDTQTPGLYRAEVLSARDEKLRDIFIQVTVAPEESRVQKLTGEERTVLLEGLPAVQSRVDLQGKAAGLFAGFAPGPMTDVVPWLLAGLVFFLFSESWVAGWRR